MLVEFEKTYNMNNEKLFLVALHTDTKVQVHKQAKIILENGADGVILVNKKGNLKTRGREPNMISVGLEIKKQFREKLIGLNMTDVSITDAMQYMPNEALDILWSNESGIIERDGKAFLDPQVVQWFNILKCQYYGSAYFEYQPSPENPPALMIEASARFSAVITGGDTYGVAPHIKKIKAIRNWIGPDAKLGITGGLSIENTLQFLPYVNILIVGSSLTVNDMFTYDAQKVRDLADEIHAYAPH